MRNSVYFISLISIYFLSNTYSQNSPKVPGSSGCTYFGNSNYSCNLPFVSVQELPEECTSFIWIGLLVDPSQDTGQQDPNIPVYIKSLSDSGKPAFAVYNHQSIQDTVNAILSNKNDGGMTVQRETDLLKSYFNDNNITNYSGIIIGSITITPDTKNTTSLTDNFKFYIDQLKIALPDYGIGLLIESNGLRTLLEQPNPPEWLNFTVLDPVVDFYVLDSDPLNACTDQFKTGVNPINSSAGYTLEQFLKLAVDLGIPKEKSYIFMSSGPFSTDASVNPCDLTNQKICASPSRDGYCADNTQSFYEKGLFLKQNAAGFIASAMDVFDDPFNCCQCGTPFPAFHDILAGFNGEGAPDKCPLFDKE